MLSKSKRFIITFNGEIYNHKDIKEIEKKENQKISGEAILIRDPS